MTTALTPAKSLALDMAKQEKAIEASLPEGLSVKKFMRTAVNAITTHSQADKLLKADRKSLFTACQKAASDGLIIDGKEATLTVFSGEVVYMPMTQGLVKLARNSGEIGNIIAEVVYENDDFVYRPGIDDQPQHSPDWFGQRGAPIGAYAVVSVTGGEKIAVVMPKARIMAIAKGGKNIGQYDPVKGAHFAEWWRKTVIKNVLKYAPKSTELERALASDNEHIDPSKIPSSYEAPPAPIDDINNDLGVAEKVHEGELVDTDII